MFNIGDKVIAKPSAGIFGAVRKADSINQPFLYIVSMTQYQTYVQCGVSHHPYFYSSDVSFVGENELLLYNEDAAIESVIKKQHRVGVLKLKIDRALEKKDKAAFERAVKELKEVEVVHEQGEHD